MSLRYPFISHHGEEGWHTRIPLAGVNLADNANLQVCCRTHIEEGGDEGELGDDAPHRGQGGSSRVSQVLRVRE